MTGEVRRQTINLFRPDVPRHLLQAISVTYPDITLDDNNSALVGFADASPGQISEDIDFWLQNQNIPAENVCSRLGNYKPRSESQTALLRAARYLAQEGSAQRAMGILAYGEPGLGKTHVSVGLAKEISLANHGMVTYINTATQREFPHTVGEFRTMADEGRGTIILDDVNEAYGSPGDALRSAISAVHDVGGRLFVTSNASDIDAFLAKALKPVTSTGEIELRRLQDRVRGMLLPTHLQGESYRATTAHNPWLGFTALNEFRDQPEGQ